MLFMLIKHKKKPKPIEGVDYFDKDVEEKRAAKEKKKAAEEV